MINDVADQGTLVRLSPAEADRELASGKVVATITVPPGFLGDLETTVVSPNAGYNPFEVTPVTYDVSVKSNGCYRAESPPSFVGQQTMKDAAAGPPATPP